MGSGIGKRAMEASLTALQRIQRLEGLVSLLNEDRMKFLESVNGAIAQQSEKSSTIEGVVNAIVEIIDKTTDTLFDSKNNVFTGEQPVNPGHVLDVLKTHLAIRHANQIARDKAAIVMLVEKGALTVSDKIDEDSLIVGEEVGPNSTGPGWTQMEFTNVLPEFQALLVGKAVGDEVQLGAHTLTVKEIYKIEPQKEAPTDTEPTKEAEVPEVATSGYVAQAPFAEAPAEDVQTAEFVREVDADGNSRNVQVA